MSGQPQKFVAVPKRPLRLAERIRTAAHLDHQVGLQGDAVLIERVRPLPEFFAGCVPVVLDAVSDWNYSGASQDNLDLNSCGRLPWPRVWAEWTQRHPSAGTCDIGVHLRDGSLKEVITEIGEPSGQSRGAAGFVIAQIVRSFADSVRLEVSEPMAWGVTATGRVHTSADGGFYAQARYPDPVGVDHFRLAMRMWCLFTALLSVRNIETIDVRIPRAQIRRLELRDPSGPLPWISYKTLGITVPRATSAGRGQTRTPMQQPIPFHLVRGNLADYRDGAGMFGDPRWRTVVWRPMHYRGLQRIGAVAKTYHARVARGAES